MRLSPAAEYAVRGVLVLAERHGQEPTNLDTICAARDLSKQYLTKIFSSLSRANIVIPVRGKHGGFLLARDPHDITLLDVIEAVEGPVALNFCQSDPPLCEEGGTCPVHPVWCELQEIVKERLGAKTLGDCIDHLRAARTAPAD